MLPALGLAIPPWTPRVYHLGPIPIDPWMSLVCIGIIVGLELARHRGIKWGLDVRDVVDGAAFTVAFGFIGGHLMHVLAYNPQMIKEEGWIVVAQIWRGYSSMGGLLGAVGGFMVFFTWIRPRDRWRHADVIIFGYPVAQFFGRLGCFSVHDHVGEQTNFFLGVTFRPGQLEGDLPGGSIRHDLGLYEALICLGVTIVFLYLARSARKGGYFVAVWCVIYGPLRFMLDFMRKSDLGQRYNDTRYAGLTPGQYVTLGIVSVGLYLIFRKKVLEPVEAEAQPTG